MRTESEQDLQVFRQHLKPKYFHMLFKDEIGDLFLLTKHMEIFVYSPSVLGVYAWNDRILKRTEMEGKATNIQESDDHVIGFRTPIENLDLLLSFGVFRRRPDREGVWWSAHEKILGHRIFTFTPDDAPVRYAAPSGGFRKQA